MDWRHAMPIRLLTAATLLVVVGCGDQHSGPSDWEEHRLPYSPPHGFFGCTGVIELVPVHDSSGDPATDALLQALSDGSEFEITFEAGPYPNEIAISDVTSIRSDGEVSYRFFEWDKPINEGRMHECTFRIEAAQIDELRGLLVVGDLLKIESYWTGELLDNAYVVCTIRCREHEHRIIGDGTMPAEMIDLYDWICLEVYAPNESAILVALPARQTKFLVRTNPDKQCRH